MIYIYLSYRANFVGSLSERDMWNDIVFKSRAAGPVLPTVDVLVHSCWVGSDLSFHNTLRKFTRFFVSFEIELKMDWQGCKQV